MLILCKIQAYFSFSQLAELFNEISRIFLSYTEQGPVVQSIVGLTSSLRGQLVKCFMTSLLNTLIFFLEKMREAFALQKLLALFQQKILAYIRY